MLNVIKCHPALAPIWRLSHGRLVRMDNHNERCPWQVHHPPFPLLPHCSTSVKTWDAQTQPGLEQCSSHPPLALAHVPSVYTTVISLQTKVPALKNVPSSSWDLQIQLNPQQTAQDSDPEVLPCLVNEEHMYSSISNLW